LWSYAAIAQQEEEGDGSCHRLLCGVALQLHSRRKRASSPSSWSCASAELHSRKKATAVAFFVELHCNAAPQQEEEAAVAFFCCAITQQNKRKKKATAA